MRMRKKEHLTERWERQRNYLVDEPAACKGSWSERFFAKTPPESSLPATGKAPVWVELGCGKGRFTVETARTSPDALLVAVEVSPDAMITAMERAEAAGLSNVRFLDADAAQITQFFAPGEVGRVYLNFSDPWPASAQAKRRLTHPDFLRRYARVLEPGGQIHFKTDNRNLFEWSLCQFPKAGFTLSEVTRDLHAQGPRGVMTDYEEKFYLQGKPIFRCVATRGETLSARLRLVQGEEPGRLLAVNGDGETLGQATVTPEGQADFSIRLESRQRGYGSELLGLLLEYGEKSFGRDRLILLCPEKPEVVRTLAHYPALLLGEEERDGQSWKEYEVSLP